MSVELIKRILCGERIPTSDVVTGRLASAVHDGPQPSPLDTAVLVRHALRYQALNGGGDGITLPSSCNFLVPEIWAACGMDVRTLGNKFHVKARPWTPEWLDDVGKDGVEANAARGDDRNVLRSANGDPFLSRFRRTDYRSGGQRAAVRAALTTPPGNTLLVCLPTGEGKSFVFQTASVYAGTQSPGTGVTIVITPTVTLAHDQADATKELGFEDIPRAYIGGNDIANGGIADRIATGTQGLCFASPEAVCTTLRRPLIKAAEAGLLRAFVIDEAHLVDSWGANFRPEFQVLSGIRHELLRAAPEDSRPITLLLSATLTDETVRTLQRFFAVDANGRENFETFRTCAAARLRPEIEYWVADVNRFETQEPRIRETLRHVPRPAILYTTEVAHAKNWFQRLHDEGYRRLALVTGDTPDDQREAVVKQWRDATIELVVATSAFGLGIDNSNVRAVIHACLPETLDRFYQEVGRGGRDSCASLSILLPTERDVGIATSLNKPKKIGIERGLSRWRSMFHHPTRVQLEPDLFNLRLDVPPGNDAGDLDMLGKESTQWNARTLTLMASGGLIQLCGVQSQLEAPADDSVKGTWHPAQTVRILDPTHQDKLTWETRVEPERHRLSLASERNLDAMKKFLQRDTCVADILGSLYEIANPTKPDQPLIPVTRACGGCPACRSTGTKWWSQPGGEPAQPWPTLTPRPSLQNWFDNNGWLAIFCPTALMDGTAPVRHARRMTQALTRLVNLGISNVIVLDQTTIEPQLFQKEAIRPIFVSDRLAPNHLPKAPTAVFLRFPHTLSRLALEIPRPTGEERILFLPENCCDPIRPNVPFKESYRGRQLTFEDVLERTQA